ncbi:MAG: helix-turn-helix domain-containing protein [Anaerolineae bacterium]|nr:helix-turn-helix domain-containing protein [Anaerolineae bacterium]
MVTNLGSTLKKLRRNKGVRITTLAQKMGFKAAAPLRNIEGGQIKKPRRETIDKIAEALELHFEDRILLYGLAGHLPEFPLPNDKEISMNLTRLDFIYKSSIPMLVIDYDYRVWKANGGIGFITGKDENEIEDLVKQQISMFQIIFDHSLNFRPFIQDWDNLARDSVRDFISLNILRRHKDFFQSYPQRMKEYIPEFEEFVSIWNEVAEDDEAYDKLILSRSLGLRHRPVILKHPDSSQELSFYISRHPIPILNNLFRLIRFVPENDVTWKYFETAPRFRKGSN